MTCDCAHTLTHRASRRPVSAMIAAGMAAGALALCIGVSPAQADSGDMFTAIGTDQESAQTEAKSSESAPPEKIEVDLLAEQRADAQAKSLIANVKSYGIEQQAQALELMLPDQQAKSQKAAAGLYKIKQDKFNVAEMLLSSQTLDEFITRADYQERVTQGYVDEVERVSALYDEIDGARDKAATVKAEAAENLQTAEQALTAAQKERADKAASAVAVAQSQARVLGGSASIGFDGAGNDQGDFRMAAMKDTEPLDSGANWYSTREEFIAEWAPRIDKYFVGTPRYGHGKDFAASSWKYCIDPRWSAAISNTESSKGRVCIRPHNAWGWGAADSDPYNLAAEWSTWEKAIDSHAKGLAEGYGYTITIKGAQRYCPYTWQSWYNRTLSEMAKI